MLWFRIGRRLLAEPWRQVSEVVASDSRWNDARYASCSTRTCTEESQWEIRDGKLIDENVQRICCTSVYDASNSINTCGRLARRVEKDLKKTWKRLAAVVRGSVTSISEVSRWCFHQGYSRDRQRSSSSNWFKLSLLWAMKIGSMRTQRNCCY